MKRWWGDTLFRRLFILMWVALVGSHVVAFSVNTLVMSMQAEPGRARPPMMRLPTFPSLPPTPGLEGWHGGPGGPDSHDRPPGGLDQRPPGMDPGTGMAPPHVTPPGQAPEALPKHTEPMVAHRPMPFPTSMLVLDYGVRLLIIGLAAWLGARWLSRPMHTLASASRSLTASLGQDDAKAVRLDEAQGTTEVRETARVFNEMAGQLSEQFKTRGLLVASLSHDLRTPLTRMRMRLACLPDDPVLDRCVGDIREMNELIDSALELFRGSSSTEPAQNTDVCSVVQSLTDDLIEQGQPVTFQGATAIARAQPTLLRRVVSNLIGNAVRYGQRADVTVSLQGDQVSIVVEDTGPGIPPEQLDAVFRPFYRVEGSRNRHTGGAGLGLYIARDLMVRQGGTLTLVNRPQGGLRAQVLLPRAPVSTSTQSR